MIIGLRLSRFVIHYSEVHLFGNDNCLQYVIAFDSVVRCATDIQKLR